MRHRRRRLARGRRKRVPFQALTWPNPDFYREVAFLYSGLGVSPEDVVLWATEAVATVMYLPPDVYNPLVEEVDVLPEV